MPEKTHVSDVRRGDRVWAPNDGDWLLVDRIEVDDIGDVIFYRIDHSEATFDRGTVVMCEVRHKDFPEGRRPKACPGACCCVRVCGQAVIDGRLDAVASDEEDS